MVPTKDWPDLRVMRQATAFLVCGGVLLGTEDSPSTLGSMYLAQRERHM